MNDLLQKSRQRPVIGTCCVSTSPEFVAPTVAAGLDFVFIDTEHIAIPRDKLSWMCRAYGAANVPPIVRVPEPEPYCVCEYLDGGAQGIVAPYVETLDQVLTLVGAVKLRPLKGAKLAECLDVLRADARARAADKNREATDRPSVSDTLQPTLGKELCDYIGRKNEKSMLFINVESVAAMACLDLLLSVLGLDGVFIGPADLSVSLGLPRQWHHETFHQAVTTIVRETSKRGLSVGCHYSFDKALEYQKKWVSEGADMIIHASDISLFSRALQHDLGILRSGISSLNGDSSQQGKGDGSGDIVI